MKRILCLSLFLSTQLFANTNQVEALTLYKFKSNEVKVLNDSPFLARVISEKFEGGQSQADITLCSNSILIRDKNLIPEKEEGEVFKKLIQESSQSAGELEYVVTYLDLDSSDKACLISVQK